MLITYTNENETVVCSLEREREVLNDYFTEGGRDLDDYNREEHKTDICSIESKANVNRH